MTADAVLEPLSEIARDAYPRVFDAPGGGRGFPPLPSLEDDFHLEAAVADGHPRMEDFVQAAGRTLAV